MVVSGQAGRAELAAGPVAVDDAVVVAAAVQQGSAVSQPAEPACDVQPEEAFGLSREDQAAGAEVAVAAEPTYLASLDPSHL